MDVNEKINELRQRIEDLSEDVKKLGEKQNAQYTDIMLELKKISKDVAIAIEATESDERPEGELYEQAKEVVIEAQKASAALLQRSLSLGYARASRLLDMLEDAGIIGKGDGAKPREVFIKDE